MLFLVLLPIIASLDYTGLVHEDCIAKMRLLSLVDLASNESGQVPYSLIRDTLKVIFHFPFLKSNDSATF